MRLKSRGEWREKENEFERNMREAIGNGTRENQFEWNKFENLRYRTLYVLRIKTQLIFILCSSISTTPNLRITSYPLNLLINTSPQRAHATKRADAVLRQVLRLAHKATFLPSISFCNLPFQFRLRRLAETHGTLFTLVLQPGKEGFGTCVKVFNVLIKGSVGFLVARGSLGLGAPSCLAIQLKMVRRNLLSHPKREVRQIVDYKGDFKVPEDPQNDCMTLRVRLLDLETTVSAGRGRGGSVSFSQLGDPFYSGGL